MVTVTYNGENPLPVFERLMLPGERRELNPKQADQLEERYPGLFSVVIPKIVVSQLDVDTFNALGLSARVVEALGVAGVTAADLDQMDDDELLAISGIGDAAVREIRKALEHGSGEWTD